MSRTFTHHKKKKRRQKNNSWQFDKWVGHNIYGARLKGSCRRVHEWNQNWMLRVLCHSMHFKKDPPLESASNYGGDVKVPTLSRISLCDGLSKSASLWQSIQAHWSTAPPRTTSQSQSPHPDWTESPGCHRNPSACHISTIWDLDKGLLMSRLDRVHNHNQLTQIVHWDMWQCKQKDAVSPELGSYSKALHHPKTTLPAETSYCWLLSSMLDYFYCFLSIITPLSSILTSPTLFYSPSSLPVSAFKPRGSWQWRRQMQWPGELPQSSESCCVFCTDFLLLFFFLSLFLWSLPMIACFLQSCDELDCSFSPFSYQDPGERRSYSEG